MKNCNCNLLRFAFWALSLQCQPSVGCLPTPKFCDLDQIHKTINFFGTLILKNLSGRIVVDDKPYDRHAGN